MKRGTWFKIGILTIAIAFAMSGCEEGESEGYFFEDEADEEVYYEEAPTPVPKEKLQDPLSGESTAIQASEDVDTDTIPEYEDKEPEANTVKDLINVVLTDGALDTQKVKASIINTMIYISEQKMKMSFACEHIAYVGCNIMLPLPPNSTSTSLYVPHEMGGKKYHFIIFNYRGRVSGKNYIVDCKRNDFNYKELFVFYPEADQRTQSSLLLAVSDAYLKDVETMVNINWRVGEEDAENQDYGVVQYNLLKQLPR